jgi:hypothetical protein
MIPRVLDLTDVWETAEAAIEMFIFAERYGIQELRTDAVARLEWCWGLAIRALLKEGYHTWGGKDHGSLSMLPKDLLVDVLEDVYRSPDADYGSWTPCDFHKHANKTEKTACRVRVLMDRVWEEDEDDD